MAAANGLAQIEGVGARVHQSRVGQVEMPAHVLLYQPAGVKGRYVAAGCDLRAGLGLGLACAFPGLHAAVDDGQFLETQAFERPVEPWAAAPKSVASAPLEITMACVAGVRPRDCTQCHQLGLVGQLAGIGGGAAPFAVGGVGSLGDMAGLEGFGVADIDEADIGL